MTTAASAVSGISFGNYHVTAESIAECLVEGVEDRWGFVNAQEELEITIDAMEVGKDLISLFSHGMFPSGREEAVLDSIHPCFLGHYLLDTNRRELEGFDTKTKVRDVQDIAQTDSEFVQRMMFQDSVGDIVHNRVIFEECGPIIRVGLWWKSRYNGTYVYESREDRAVDGRASVVCDMSCNEPGWSDEEEEI